MIRWAWLGVLFSMWAFAEAAIPSKEGEIRGAIARAYPGTEVILTEGVDPRILAANKVSYTGDSGAGTAYFLADGHQVKVPYAAYVSALSAVRRISPAERLEAALFVDQKVNLALPENRLLRGLSVSRSLDLTSLEAAQTILPGAVLTLPMTKRSPLVRRGDPIELKVTSGGVTLTTGAVAQEPGLAGERIRVLTRQTKREFSGKLISKSTVEVAL